MERKKNDKLRRHRHTGLATTSEKAPEPGLQKYHHQTEGKEKSEKCGAETGGTRPPRRYPLNEVEREHHVENEKHKMRVGPGLQYLRPKQEKSDSTEYGQTGHRQKKWCEHGRGQYTEAGEKNIPGRSSKKGLC